MLKGLLGIVSIGVGGAILVYALFKLMIDIGTNYSTYFDLQTNLPTNAIGGFLAFLLFGLGLWLIVRDKP